jgi:CarD family transcriptional regulator
MFEVGDKIFYPMHGAGIIESVEEKEILGETQLYYVMKLPIGKMQVMIPMNKTSNLGIRQIVDADIMENVLTSFHQGETEDSTTNPSQRYRMNTNRMKSGDIYEGAQVIRDLMRIGKKKSLGTGDKLMLNNARQIFISELVMVKGLEQEQATDLLDKVINI